MLDEFVMHDLPHLANEKDFPVLTQPQIVMNY